jgi:hypothetical protein
VQGAVVRRLCTSASAKRPGRTNYFASTQIGDQLGRELLNAYLATLKAKSEVKINQGNLEKK